MCSRIMQTISDSAEAETQRQAELLAAPARKIRCRLSKRHRSIREFALIDESSFQNKNGSRSQRENIDLCFRISRRVWIRDERGNFKIGARYSNHQGREAPWRSGRANGGG